jgi:hypothetical protein
MTYVVTGIYRPVPGWSRKPFDKRYGGMHNRTFMASALALALGSSASAQPAGRCTHETLMVRGTPVSASYCVSETGAATSGRELPVRVGETFSTPHASFNQEVTLRFIAGEQDSRVIEDVALDRLGLQGTLHLTLLLRGGAVRVESAMLTPGAITIK